MNNTKNDNRSRTSRLNALKSTGPKTDAGKLRASTNAVTHGAYAKSLLLPGEDLADFQSIIATNFQTWKPADPVEELLVTEMAATLWRLRRQASAETTLIDLQIKRMAPMFTSEFEFVSASGYYCLAVSALNQHGETLSQLSRQSRRLLQHYKNLCAQLLTLRQSLPPATPDSNGPIDATDQRPSHPVESQPMENKRGETKLKGPTISLQISPEMQVSNPNSALYAALPPIAEPSPIVKTATQG